MLDSKTRCCLGNADARQQNRFLRHRFRQPFDEAQRAWNLDETASFMRRKKNTPNFVQSEPEFLMSCLDRHHDWAVVVCLVGGGQEINRGEAGISEWIESLERSFPDWRIYLSSKLMDSEYGAGQVLKKINSRPNVAIDDALHLAVSMRSFRAENVSHLVKQLLDLELHDAQHTLTKLREKYPIVLTRDLSRAKQWLRTQARGSERYGILVSSQAERLKPHAIREIAGRPHPLVSRSQGRRALILLLGGRCNRVSRARTGVGLGMRHLGRGFPPYRQRLGTLVFCWRSLEQYSKAGAQNVPEKRVSRSSDASKTRNGGCCTSGRSG